MARGHLKGDTMGRRRNPLKWGYGVFHNVGGSAFISNDMVAFYDTAREAKARAKELNDDLKQNRSQDYYRGENYTVRKAHTAISNPGIDEDDATSLSEGFHGRPARDIIDIVEIEKFRSKLAHLGYLVEFELLAKTGRSVIPIVFPSLAEGDPEDKFVSLSSTTNRRQLLLVGGDQTIDLESFEDLTEFEKEKDYVELGEVFSVSYFADKHHLEGPASQKDGTEYIHKFGEEEGGERPRLIYDRLNERMLLVGGSYEVRDEGIFN